MKTDQTSPLSIVDAVTQGLGAAVRAAWLIAIPAAIDLTLWLGPRLTINNLVQRFLVIWEAFFRLGLGADQPAAGDMVPAVREGLTQVGQGLIWPRRSPEAGCRCPARWLRFNPPV